MAAWSIPTSLLFFLFFFFFLLLVSSSLSMEGVTESESVSREVFSMEEDVAWVVQVSDLHISAFHPDRADDLVKLLAPALRVIRPSLLLITGDITDAKNKERTSTRQDESEWIQYRNAIDAVVRLSGIDKKTIFDIRGNHDKYGVPHVGSKLDFFSTYSVSSQLDRHSNIQSISLVGNDWKYNFLGIDDSMSIGLRGPSHLFGHPTDRRIDAVESELQSLNSHPGASVRTVVYGHFPMSFTASSEKGERYESMFAKQSISTYLCGHLHAKFGKQLWRLHTIEVASDPQEPKRVKQFWEWELGDWKEYRLIRILAVDGGEVSFLDIELPSKHGVQEDFQTAVLITYPTDSRSMNRIESDSQLLRNDISALVFSVEPILNVTAKVFDSSREFRLVEEVPLQLVTSSAKTQPLFRANWNAGSYKTASATRYWLQVFVLDSQGKETVSTLRPFSVEGKLAHFPSTWLAYLVFHVRWEKLYSVLLWSNVSFLIMLLSLPKLLNHSMERNSSYQRWAMSVSVSSPIPQQRFFFWILWFMIEGSRNRKLWYAMVLYFLYLLKFPWFWGHATSENGEIGKMSLFGWTVNSPNSPLSNDKLGTPDLMVVTLPFMYMVVSPLVLLVYSLFAERSAFFLHSCRKPKCSNEPISSNMESEESPELVTKVPPKSSKGMIISPKCKLCDGWTRKALLLACLVLSYIHYKLCSSNMRAYGLGAVGLSPAFSWAPPLLLAAAIYATMTSVN